MSLLSYTELVELIEAGVIDAPIENVNPASIEVTLGNEIMVEHKPTIKERLIHYLLRVCPMFIFNAMWEYKRDFVCHYMSFNDVSLYAKENIKMDKVVLNGCYRMAPGEFILASTVETFNLPNDIVAEYVCKSSMCRNGLNHLLAGYADPGFNNSKLTLELINNTKHHSLSISAGQKIGQMKFYRVKDVPEDQSYAKVGNYNGQKTVQQSKGIQ